MTGQTIHLVLPQISIFYFCIFQGKSINFTIELGSSVILFIKQQSAGTMDLLK